MNMLCNSRPNAICIAMVLTLVSVVGVVRPLIADDSSASEAHRIVAVGGSVTEVVYALGQEDRLVARDSTSTYPAEASLLPNVGYIRALSPEGVLSVDPDLILMLEGSGPREAVDVLKKSGIEIAEIPDDFTVKGILDKIQAIGNVLGTPEKAAELVNHLEAELKIAQADAKTLSSGARVLFILSTKGGPILASGTDTAADGIIKLSGGQNAVSNFRGYKQLSDEAILSANPDIVLMMDRTGSNGISADALFDHPALALTSAGQNKRLVKMHGQYLLGFGPRTADAIRDLAAQLAEVRS